MVFSLQAIVVAVAAVSAAVRVFLRTVSARRAHLFVKALRYKARPIRKRPAGGAPERKPVEIVSARGQENSVLDRIDARIDAGECVALMGPSGSGKSTLMNIIGCLDQRGATICSAVVRSGDWMTLGAGRIRKSGIGFVFQNFNLLPRLTAAARVAARLCR